ncbi:hypothetical protein NVSP9465_01954 [Novosphingobium sp. CECT 9465]|nr:hypothetical protein NVSP9465_01954 [Novosphingobium sp. CECT 9465]
MGHPVAAKVAIGRFFLIKRTIDAGMARRLRDRLRLCPSPECLRCGKRKRTTVRMELYLTGIGRISRTE